MGLLFVLVGKLYRATSWLQGAVHTEGSFCASSHTELTTCDQIQNCKVTGDI